MSETMKHLQFQFDSILMTNNFNINVGSYSMQRTSLIGQFDSIHTKRLDSTVIPTNLLQYLHILPYLATDGLNKATKHFYKLKWGLTAQKDVATVYILWPEIGGGDLWPQLCSPASSGIQHSYSRLHPPSGVAAYPTLPLQRF